VAFKNPMIGEEIKDINKNTDLATTEPLDNIRNDDVICKLASIESELKKLNMYFAMITNTQL